MYQKLCSRVKLCTSVSGSAHSVGLILQKNKSPRYYNVNAAGLIQYINRVMELVESLAGN